MPIDGYDGTFVSVFCVTYTHYQSSCPLSPFNRGRSHRVCLVTWADMTIALTSLSEGQRKSRSLARSFPLTTSQLKKKKRTGRKETGRKAMRRPHQRRQPPPRTQWQDKLALVDAALSAGSASPGTQKPDTPGSLHDAMKKARLGEPSVFFHTGTALPPPKSPGS
jgi:hypothetical protein